MLRNVVQKVGAELGHLGFSVDCNQITIDVKEASDMAAMFNQISDEARQEVSNHTPSGPAMSMARQDKSPSFRDGDSSRLAFYDPNSKSIVFKKGSLSSLTRGYLAHELAHAYQDQKWGFDKIWETYQKKPSREIFNVTQFMIEGHAELVRNAYEQNEADSQKDVNDISLALGGLSENDCIPCHTKQSDSTLPYTFGMRFLVNQYRSGGWPLVESLLMNLPPSTEQIIHENKYQEDHPTELSLPNWDAQGTKTEPLLNGSLGEAFLLAKLLSMSIPPEQAFATASGWDGDVAQLYRISHGREVLVWRILFDRLYDAQQLEEAVKGSGGDNDVFRVGRVVDWIITKFPDLKKSTRIFLSKHPLHVDAQWADEQSTIEQEVSIKNDAQLFSSPYFVPKIFIGPNL